jgi:hypothetical protein
LDPVAPIAASAHPDTAFFLAYLASQAATRKFLEQGFDIAEVILAPSQKPVLSQFDSLTPAE